MTRDKLGSINAKKNHNKLMDDCFLSFLCNYFISDYSTTETETPYKPQCLSKPRTGPEKCHMGWCYNGDCKGFTIVDDTPVVQCTCDSGWTGDLCQFCCDLQCGHGMCKLASNMSSYCECQDEYTGQFCDTPPERSLKTSISNTQTTSQLNNSNNPMSSTYYFYSSSSESPLLPCDDTRDQGPSIDCVDTPCLNGYCTISHDGGVVRGTCNCYSDWEGDQCDKCCSLECDHGTCSWNETSSEKYCDCDEGYTSDFCDVMIPFVSCREPNILPDPQYCQGLKCYHGECDYSEGDFGTRVFCTCNDSWIGRSCDTCCDLPCVNGGACNVYEGEMECLCDAKHTGVFCNETVTTPVPPTVIVTVQNNVTHIVSKYNSITY